MASLAASALAGLLVAASLSGRPLLAAAVVSVLALLMLGVVRAADIPASKASALVALLAGALAAGMVASNEGALDVDALRPVLVAVGGGFVATVIVQLTRRDGRERLTASWTLGVTALVLSAAAATWLGLGDDDLGSALLPLALAGVATAAAIAVFPGPQWLWAIGGTIGAASVGPIMAAYAPAVAETAITPGQAALVAGTSGLAAACGLWVARLVRDDRSPSQAPMSGQASLLLTAALPVVLAAPVAFAAAWAVTSELVV